MTKSFHPFGLQHFLAVLCGGTVITLLILMGKKGGKPQRFATGTFASICLAAFPLSVIGWLTLDVEKSLDNLLPFHLCDITAVIGGLALLLRKPLLSALTYFWGLAASIQGVLTPAIPYGFPHLPFIMFFVHHFAIVGTALYLPIVHGWRPKQPLWKSPIEVYGWSLGYLAFAMGINRVLHTNFGFASRPPSNPSLIDHLGPWPWYLVSISAIALFMYFLLVLPFARADRPGK